MRKLSCTSIVVAAPCHTILMNATVTRLSVLQNDMSPILNQLVFGYAFAVRVGDAPVEEVILNKIKQAAPSIENLEGAVKIAVDSGFHDTFKLVSLPLSLMIRG